MLVAESLPHWILIGQVTVWFIGFPLIVVGLLTYIWYQVVAERRENQQLDGRWGAEAKRRRELEP